MARTLYRPVGPAELQLVADSGWTAFPPRLPEQPIFYPVENETYARQIAREWNVKSSGAGYVLRFDVDEAFLRAYPCIKSVRASTANSGCRPKISTHSTPTSSARSS
jgi:hypothetical protein